MADIQSSSSTQTMTASATIPSRTEFDSLELNNNNNNNNNDDVIDANEDEGAVGGTLYCGRLDPDLPIPTEQDWTEEELDRDPHREYFYDAYRSAASTPDLDESGGSLDQIPVEQRPLALMDDWEMWDHMDDDTLKQRLRNHPVLLEQITRNRKRRAAALEETEEDVDLCAVMERHAKVTKFNEHTTVC